MTWLDVPTGKELYHIAWGSYIDRLRQSFYRIRTRQPITHLREIPIPQVELYRDGIKPGFVMMLIHYR